jgi:GNAT superfamily N-acetyltransferase
VTAVPFAIRAVDWDDPRAASLRDAQQAEIRSLYGGDDTEPGVKPTAADVGVFLVAFDDDEAVGCGGLRPLDDEHGEIKRMYVRPGHRGRGVSTAILTALEHRARQLGWRRLVLETGTEQKAAIGFYTREGYAPIPLFGHYAGSPLSLCFAKELGAA